MSYKIHCAVGFWGSIHYDLGGGTGVEVTYSTFSGSYTCTLSGLLASIGSCTNGDMHPENPNGWGENWHYSFSVPVACCVGAPRESDRRRQ
jgi:hypothetical protein